jgi:uncharacterized membrane protein
MTDGEPELLLRVARMEAFSDGVFAIAITLLVLEISVPEGSEGHLLQAVLGLWPSYLAYAVSFATIGALWLGHNAITHYLHRTNSGFLRLNLGLLLVISFLPFPTKLLAENLGSKEDEAVAATIFGTTLLLATSMLSGLWRYALRNDLVHPDADDRETRLLARRLTPSLGIYVALIVLGWFRPLAAVIGYLLVAFFLMVPIKRRRRAMPPIQDGSEFTPRG